MPLLLAALLFLLLSFGDMTPLRQAINPLPGFSYFRNPAIFRFYFILSLILFAAIVLQKSRFEEIIHTKAFRYTLVFLAIACLLVFLLNTGSLGNLSLPGLKNADYSTTLLISSLIQLLLISLLLLLIRRKKWSWALWVFAGDLVINTLICTPFFSVSSYSLPEVNALLRSEKGFPVQQRKVGDVAATFKDEKGNTWQNVNIFRREVSANESYRGPLVLKDTSDRSSYLNRPLVFSRDSSAAITILVQRPTHVKARVNMAAAGNVTLLQNYYPGWKAYVNDKEAGIIRENNAFISVAVPAGESTISFRYERKQIWLSALLVHLVILIFGVIKIRDAVKANRSASLSLLR